VGQTRRKERGAKHFWKLKYDSIVY